MSEANPKVRIFDIEEVKLAAQNRWAETFTQLAGVDPQILDGSNHACPKHCSPDSGGKDRFRFIDKTAGALLCNQCFNKKNGDGIAAVEWLLDCDFKTALTKIGDHFGVQPRKKAAGLIKAGGKPAKIEAKGKEDTPGRRFKPFAGTETVLKETALTHLKQGILKERCVTLEGVKRIGCKLGSTYISNKFSSDPDLIQTGQSSFEVATLGFPVHFPDGHHGWKMRRCSGGEIPTTGGSAKSLNESGSHGTGIIGSTEGEIVFFCEGEIDLLALYSIMPDGGKFSAFTINLGDKAALSEKTVCQLNGKTVICLYDKAENAAIQCENIIKHSTATVKDCNFEWFNNFVAKADLEKWLANRYTFDDLMVLVDNAEVVKKNDSLHEQIEISKLSEEDPRRVAWENLKSYQTNGRRLVFWQGRWFRYKENHYRDIRKDELIPKVRKFVEAEYVRIWERIVENHEPKSPEDEPPKHPKSVKDRTVIEVVKAMESLCSISNETTFPGWISSPERSTANIIPLKNGLLDIKKLVESKTKKTANADFFFPHTSDFFSPTCLDYEYRELDAADERLTKSNFWKFIRQSFPGQPGLKYRTLLQEWAGYLLTSDNSFKVFMVCQGSGDNGKGVFLTILKTLLGKQNCSSVELAKLGASFSAANYYDKLLNICDESSGISDDSLNTIKRLSGGSDVNVNRKFEPAFDTECRCRFILCCNEMPEFKDSSQATANRLLFVPWDNVVREEDKRREFMSPEFWKESGELELILSWAIDGLIRLHQNNRFTYSEDQKAVSLELAQSSFEIDWFEDYFDPEAFEITGNEEDYIPIDDVFRHYCFQAKQLGIKAKYCNKSLFSRFLKQAFAGRDKFRKTGRDRKRSGTGRVSVITGIIRNEKDTKKEVASAELFRPKPKPVQHPVQYPVH